MCWNKLIQGGDLGTVWASAQHTPGSTHAIPDGTERGDDSSPLPHPPKPKLGPGSGPRVGPAPEGDSFQPLPFPPELCRRMMMPVGQKTQLEGSTSCFELPLSLTQGPVGTQNTREYLFQHTLKVCTSPGHVKTPHTCPRPPGSNLAMGPNAESQSLWLMDYIHFLKTSTRKTCWKAPTADCTNQQNNSQWHRDEGKVTGSEVGVGKKRKERGYISKSP